MSPLNFKSFQINDGTKAAEAYKDFLSKYKPKKKARKKPELKEEKEHIDLKEWFDLQYPKEKVFHFANGGSRKPTIINGRAVPLEAMRLKKMGVVAGAPDFFLPVPRGGFHGLILELKFQGDEVTRAGKVSDDQKKVHDYFISRGYCVKVAWGFDEGKKIFTSYMKSLFLRSQF